MLIRLYIYIIWTYAYVYVCLNVNKNTLWTHFVERQMSWWTVRREWTVSKCGMTRLWLASKRHTNTNILIYSHSPARPLWRHLWRQNVANNTKSTTNATIALNLKNKSERYKKCSQTNCSITLWVLSRENGKKEKKLKEANKSEMKPAQKDFSTKKG